MCANNKGYKAKTSLNSVKLYKTPCWFGRGNPYTIDNIKTFIKNNKLESELISDKYINNSSNLTFKCNRCGDLYETTWNTFQDRKLSYCQECVKEIHFNGRKHDIEFVRNEFIKNNYKPMFSQYTRSHDKLLVADVDGYIGYLSYRHLKAGQGFDICHKANPHSIQNIKHYIRINNLKCNVLEDEYISNSTKMKFECECGEVFQTQWDTFCAGKHRCSKCTNAKSIGEYKVETWLKEHSIPFETQYTFDECKYIRLLRFDICAYPDADDEDKVLIEINGLQHYQPVDFFGGEDGYKVRVMRDEVKDDFCRDNKIKLLKIPYVNIEDDSYKELLRKEFNSV